MIAYAALFVQYCGMINFSEISVSFKSMKKSILFKTYLQISFLSCTIDRKKGKYKMLYNIIHLFSNKFQGCFSKLLYMSTTDKSIYIERNLLSGAH